MADTASSEVRLLPQCEPSASSAERSAEERKVVWKLDKRILPITCLLYLFAYLDRSNLGNARLQGLPEDVLGGDPTGTLFDWANSAFFFSYILIQVPATILSKLVRPRVWVAWAAFGWGLSSMLQATVFNFAGLVTARLFLGTFESGFGPAISVYFSLFYTKEELGLRMAYWFGFAAVAGAFGGAIAFGVQQLDVSIANWRLLFLIEGFPALVMSIVTYHFFPDRPESTTYLTEEERDLAVSRMNRGTTGDVGAVVNGSHIMAALVDWRVYIAGVMYFGLNCALASISAFLPTIIKTFGYIFWLALLNAASANAQLMTVPPYAAAAAILLLLSFVSDRLQTRGVMMAATSFFASVGYMMLLGISHNNHIRYLAIFLIASGTYTTIGLTIAWFGHNLGSETKKATGIPMFMAIGQCGSILGSHIYPGSEGPAYTRGFAISCILELLAALCAIILTISYRVENARRDRIHGKPTAETRVDSHEFADQAPMFRYVL